MQMIPARWFTAVGPARPKELIVLHSMEAADKPDTAAAVGRYFASLPSTSKASAHIGVDSAEEVRYVADDDVAYGAPGANHNGLQLEQTGYAAYTAGQWHADQMVRMLGRSAAIIADWCNRYPITPTFLGAAALKAGKVGGVTTHRSVTEAWALSTHTDPGPDFPTDWLLRRVEQPVPTPLEAKGIMNSPCVAILSTPSGKGYYLVGSDGGVFAFGDAAFHGSLGGVALNKPVVGAALHPGGAGYWLVAADGGVFAFGDAQFLGSMAEKAMNGPVVGIAAAPSGSGYWLAGNDGGVFAFGDAGNYGTPYDIAKRS